MNSYQTFTELGINGNSKSPQKLEALHLPIDMTGKNVLDIGCNAGFFCFEVARRGATALGIDKSLETIRQAQEIQDKLKVENVSFYVADWDNFDEGKYDYILWLSGFHYAREKQSYLFHKYMGMLKLGGRMILECGISEKNPGRYFVEKYARAEGENPAYYLNRTALSHITTRFIITEIGPSVKQGGDKLDRYVFSIGNIEGEKTFVICGESGTGKSFIGRQLVKNGFSMLCWDVFFMAWVANHDDGQIKKQAEARHGSIKACLRYAWGLMVKNPAVKKMFIKDFCDEAIRMLTGPLVVEGEGFNDDELKTETIRRLGERTKNIRLITLSKV